MSTLENKTVIITGASAGIGAACARLLARQKARLALVARGEVALNKIADELGAETEVMAIALDVADTDACMKMLSQVEQRFGAIHILINNAGTHIRGNVDTLKPEDLAIMADVNFRAPLVLTAAVIPYIKKSGGGAIIMVASLAGRAPLQGAATYSASKAGLRAFTYAIADELSSESIKVGMVSPGPVDTGFIMDEIDKVDDIVYSQKMSTATEVAEAILQLISGDRTEIAIPAAAGKMTTLMYLFPSVRRWVRPLLQKKGRKNKLKYKKEAE
ncbi:MAG TPA: SDR family NAD(P)-dependent oxidoreductase [Aeromonadales bacterium]|nr:SDR family NAD(P)-dependent oxidoreductase [Aeromonadales bacterium]